MYRPGNESRTSRHKILEIRDITANTYVLRFERKDFQFIPGQFVSIGTDISVREREYSIYSGIHDPWIEILVRKIIDGDISVLLRQLQPGDYLRVTGPEGAMTLLPEEVEGRKFDFIATGTGIAPFRSFVRSYPQLDYRIILGVRFYEEAYDRKNYENTRFVLCTSFDKTGDYHGRVTAYIRDHDLDTGKNFYICGNSHMIYEVQRGLRLKGVRDEQMFTEVYF